MINMAFDPTEEQKKIIVARNTSLLVSAAAGSGKTAVLVESIISLVCDEKDPVDIDRILVVTLYISYCHTNKMKNKWFT